MKSFPKFSYYFSFFGDPISIFLLLFYLGRLHTKCSYYCSIWGTPGFIFLLFSFLEGPMFIFLLFFFLGRLHAESSYCFSPWGLRAPFSYWVFFLGDSHCHILNVFSFLGTPGSIFLLFFSLGTRSSRFSFFLEIGSPKKETVRTFGKTPC